MLRVSLPLLYSCSVTPAVNDQLGFRFVSLRIFPRSCLNHLQTLLEVWSLLLCIQVPQGTSGFLLFAPCKHSLLEPSFSLLQCGFLFRPAGGQLLQHSENSLSPSAVWKPLLTGLQVLTTLGLLPHFGEWVISSSSFLKMDAGQERR